MSNDINARLVEALQRIERWFGEFPPVKSREGLPSTYGVEYGSNGERDYMRKIARDALATLPTETVAVKYGCHCDIENMPDGFEPDGCVIDDNMPEICVYAHKLLAEGKGKIDCEYWRPIGKQHAEPVAVVPDGEMLNRGADELREALQMLSHGRSYQYVCGRVFKAMLAAASNAAASQEQNPSPGNPIAETTGTAGQPTNAAAPLCRECGVGPAQYLDLCSQCYRAAKRQADEEEHIYRDREGEMRVRIERDE